MDYGGNMGLSSSTKCLDFGRDPEITVCIKNFFTGFFIYVLL